MRGSSTGKGAANHDMAQPSRWWDLFRAGLCLVDLSEIAVVSEIHSCRYGTREKARKGQKETKPTQQPSKQLRRAN